jgi:hypothetical protein
MEAQGFILKAILIIPNHCRRIQTDFQFPIQFPEFQEEQTTPVTPRGWSTSLNPSQVDMAVPVSKAIRKIADGQNMLTESAFSESFRIPLDTR